MKRDIFCELTEGIDALTAQQHSSIAQQSYQRRWTVRPLGCSEHWRDFTALGNSGYICPEFRGELMIIVPLAEAKNNLSKLVDDAAAGQIITIAKHGRAMARLVPVGKTSAQRIGAMKGKLILPDDFDSPMPDDMLDAFEGTQA
nr:type II toxin-antitoxin system Phd/YefM family antitoxin [Pseudomonas sp. H1h]